MKAMAIIAASRPSARVQRDSLSSGGGVNIELRERGSS